MRRFPAIILSLAVCLSLTACASKSAMNDLADRITMLELELGLNQSGMDMNREDMRDLDSRLTFLENEAAGRGVTIPPRPVPASAQDQETVQEAAQETAPEPVTPPVQTASPQTNSRPAPDLPVSPISTASPQTRSPSSETETPVAPDSLPNPLYEPAAPDGPQNIEEPGPLQQTAQPASPPAGSDSSGSQRAYDAALQLYRTGRFSESEAAFNAFLQTYPANRMVPNALYWRGETYYARAMYVDAIFSFKDVQTRFPDNQKTPDSLLKTAMAYQKIDDSGNASLHLSVLYEDWPNSEAAKRANSLGLRP